ncbi:MAG: hypothetical protein VXX03_02205, partial [Candidatus Thermoplasmatota archaeon]|nr:hypothetical protein [Candidatus Thermoplasmatota archaeon]
TSTSHDEHHPLHGCRTRFTLTCLVAKVHERRGKGQPVQTCPFPPAWIRPHDDGLLLVGRDGEVLNSNRDGQHLGQPVCPFPMALTHGVVLGSRLLATWMDHELRMARFAALDMNALIDGPSRASVRRGEVAALHPSGHLWSHALDAEPLALIEHHGNVVLALHPNALYLIDEEGRELERTTLPEPLDSLGAGLVHLHSENDETVLVTLRDGSSHRVSFDGSAAVPLGRAPSDQPIRDVAHGPQGRLLLTESHDALWLDGDTVRMTARLSGPPGQVLWSPEHEGWLIAGWRERVLLSSSGFKRMEQNNVDVAVYSRESKVMIVDNDGTWSAFEA